MKIYLDSEEIELNLDNVNNLEDLIYDVMVNHVPGDKLVVEVKTNDVTFSERWPGEAKVIPLDKIVKIDFITESIENIASKMLDDMPVQIDSITEGMLKSAELFRVADEQEANLNFIKILNSLRSFVNFITQLKKTNVINWDALEIDEMNIDTHYEKLIKLIDEMLDVQEDEDWILLADLIEYELNPIMKKWKDFLIQANENLKKNNISQ